MSAVRKEKNMLVQFHTGIIPCSTVYAVSAAVVICALIIGAVGFAGSEIIHNAAHDVRHGLSFPCH